jgi:uncharacterized protein YjiS (DUF1127 family)
MTAVVRISTKSGLQNHAGHGDRHSSGKSTTNLISESSEEWTRERLIRNAARSLGRLDDHTLRDLGISHRSMIECTVRYCVEC